MVGAEPSRGAIVEGFNVGQNWIKRLAATYPVDDDCIVGPNVSIYPDPRVRAIDKVKGAAHLLHPIVRVGKQVIVRHFCHLVALAKVEYHEDGCAGIVFQHVP